MDGTLGCRRLVVGLTADARLNPAKAERLGEVLGDLFMKVWPVGCLLIWLLAYVRRPQPP
jgi:hypothetical protein